MPKFNKNKSRGSGFVNYGFGDYGNCVTGNGYGYGNNNNNNYYGYGRPNSLIRVNGIDGAKSYQMMQGTQALFDANDDIFYIKSVDGAGFPSIRVFRFEEVTENERKTVTSNSNYVSREEMEEYVKQFIQKPKSGSSANTTNASKSKSDADC